MKRLKKVIAVAILTAMSIWPCFAQSGTTKHVVERGETLASIAKLYSVSEDEIVRLNPDVAQFVYVGMELVLPESGTKRQEQASPVKSENALVEQTETSYDASSADDDEFRKWSLTGHLSYGFTAKPKGNGVSGSSFAFTMAAGANYNINHYFYVGARIGYSCYNFNSLSHEGIGNYSGLEITNHYIHLPVEAGFRLGDSKFALVPYAGIDFNYVVKCVQEEGVGSHKVKKSVKPDDRLETNGRIGLRIHAWGFELGGAYLLPFKDNGGESKGYFEISLGICC